FAGSVTGLLHKLSFLLNLRKPGEQITDTAARSSASSSASASSSSSASPRSGSLSQRIFKRKKEALVKAPGMGESHWSSVRLSHAVSARRHSQSCLWAFRCGDKEKGQTRVRPFCESISTVINCSTSGRTCFQRLWAPCNCCRLEGA